MVSADQCNNNECTKPIPRRPKSMEKQVWESLLPSRDTCLELFQWNLLNRLISLSHTENYISSMLNYSMDNMLFGFTRIYSETLKVLNIYIIYPFKLDTLTHAWFDDTGKLPKQSRETWQIRKIKDSRGGTRTQLKKTNQIRWPGCISQL